MRLLIADDHELLRDTLGNFLQQQDGIDICTVGDLDSAIDRLDSGALFDLILLDYTMPGMHGLDGLKLLLDRPDAPPVALISGVADIGIALDAMRLGAQGFLQKSIPAKSLLNAIHFMVAGERYLSVDEILQHFEAHGGILPVAEEPTSVSLTPRETQVLAALCDGQTNKEIARKLNLSEPTIKLHVKTLYRRLGATNRTQAAMIARDLGLN